MRCKVCDYRLWNLPSRRCPECGTEFRPSEFEFVANSVQFCCPHCGQSYYGTGPQGHLVPFEYDCVSCGRRINMDETVVLPTEGVKEEQTKVGEVPWLERRTRGFFRAWFATIAKAMVSPITLMRALPCESATPTGWGFAFLTLVSALCFGTVFPCGLWFAVGLSFAGPRGVGGGMLLGLLVYVAAYVVVVPVILGLWSLVTHLMLQLLSGGSEPFKRTAQAICFSSGAGVCLAIPCFGVYGVGWIWWIVSAILMVKEGQRTSGGKATAAVLTAPVIGTLLIVGGYALLMVKLMGMAGTAGAFPTTAPSPAFPETSAVSQALRSFAEIHQGRGPEHVIELARRNYLSFASFCVMGYATMESGVPVGDTTLDKVGRLTPQEQAAVVRKAINSLPASTIAYRFGDFIFTYPGINLKTADPKLWLFVQMPENVGTSQFQMTMYETAMADGTTAMGFSNDFTRVLKEQNAVRTRAGLPPLPDLRTVKHGRPAVVPGWFPATTPATDAESAEPADSSPAEPEEPTSAVPSETPSANRSCAWIRVDRVG